MPAEVALSADQQLSDALADYVADPVGHALFAYRWGIGFLDGQEGLRSWQEDFLGDVGEAVAERGFNGVIPVDPLRYTTRSGHGPGKSVLTGLLSGWLLDTRPFCEGIVTANTATQLRNRTWAQIVSWRKASITAHWWHITSSSSSMQIAHAGFRERWKMTGQTCAPQNSDAFAGQHAAKSTSFYIFDESSGVPDGIFEVAEGGLVSGESMIFLFGNPTRSRGKFHQTFVGPQRHRWNRRTIDTRTIPECNQKLIAEWIEDYGEDSDFVRVRVKGLPPKHGDLQLFSGELVQMMRDRPTPEVEKWEPLIMGVDVSRSAVKPRMDGTPREGAYRPARTVIRFRRGRDARTYRKVVIAERAKDTQYVVRTCATLINTYKPDAVCIDGDGIGGPVCDALVDLGFDHIHEIHGATPANNPRYSNKRTEMWHDMRDWADEHAGVIDPLDEDLQADLEAPATGANKAGKEQLESKESMLARGIASPDDGDALALTFAVEVAPRTIWDAESPTSLHQSEYEPGELVE